MNTDTLNLQGVFKTKSMLERGLFRLTLITFLGVACANVAQGANLTVLEEYQLRRASLEADDHFGQYDLGLWCINNDLLDEAIEVLEDARASKVADAYTHYQLGRAYAAVGNYRQARKRLRIAVSKAKPSDQTPELEDALEEWQELLKPTARKWHPDYAFLMVDSARHIIRLSKPTIVLIDRSKWYWPVGPFKVPDELEADLDHQCFGNYDLLGHHGLRHADVAAVFTCGKPFENELGGVTNITYDDLEVAAVHDFVLNGGGLLLVGDGAEWDRVNRKMARLTGSERLSHYDMPVNRLGGLFGLYFTTDRLDGDVVKRGSIIDHECLGEFSPDDVRVLLYSKYCRMETANSDARVLMRDGDGNPIAYSLEYGLGRVIAIGGYQLPKNEASKKVIDRMLTWLGVNDTSMEEGHYFKMVGRIESSYIVGQVRNLQVQCIPALAYRIPLLLSLVESAADTVEGYFGLQLPDMKVRMVAAFQGGVAGRNIIVPAAANPRNFIAVTAHEMTHKIYAGRMGEAIAAWGGFKAMINRGFTEDYERILQGRLDTFWENDPHATDIDIGIRGSVPGRLGKRLWVFQNLEDRYGEDIFCRFNEELKKDDMLKKKLDINEFIYYMSRAAGEDLYQMFLDIGTAVNPRYTGLPPARGLLG